jgi:hypothetical protein
MWEASRPISRKATLEYRPSGSTTAVTWVDIWVDIGLDGSPARRGAAEKITAQNSKEGAQRT